MIKQENVGNKKCIKCKHFSLPKIILKEHGGVKFPVLDLGYCSNCIYSHPEKMIDKFEEDESLKEID